MLENNISIPALPVHLPRNCHDLRSKIFRFSFGVRKPVYGVKYINTHITILLISHIPHEGDGWNWVELPDEMEVTFPIILILLNLIMSFI